MSSRGGNEVSGIQMRMTSSVACVYFFTVFSGLNLKKICSAVYSLNENTHTCVCIFCLAFAKQQGQVHWGFACCRLVQERSWLIVCCLGCRFMRLCKCVRQQQGKANSSGPSNWIYTCWRRPGFIWNKRLYSTHPIQFILIVQRFQFLDFYAGEEPKHAKKGLVMIDSMKEKSKHIICIPHLYKQPILEKMALTFVRIQVSVCSPPTLS